MGHDTDADQSEHSGVLLEVDGDDDEDLCNAIAAVAFPDVATSEHKKSALVALLAVALVQFKLPRERWSEALNKTLGMRRRTDRHERSMGSSLQMFMNGVGEVLPVTNTALRAAKSLNSPATAASLFCQCMERLLYPAGAESLVLHIALPVDA